MRRFFRAHRDEDYSQIQYLTAKCTRLAHDKVLDCEFLLSREKERKLQNDLEAVTSRLLQQEHLNVELVMNQDKLLSRIREQQELLNLLQQHVLQLEEESRRDVALLQEVGAELHHLQSSEVELQALVEELFVELQQQASQSEKLQAELLQRKEELEELHDTNKGLTEELKELHRTHQEETRDQRTQVTELQLQETAEQFEWLCQQQRCWMSYVKRWKESLVEDRQTLLRHICKLEEEAETSRKSSHDATQSLSWPVQDSCNSWSWVSGAEADMMHEKLLEEAD
ncbi:GRB10-interacting GYF protein 2 isoform X2 [Oryzias latipes]|uniref:GRB10-interacting GYF protein 2 isoform X2 n=1 Tax=Oryzias latipes TaxID=8090 RepID=UPI0009DA119B|nr:GRB10-interacting GYF protein 2 isoform X2 [Oryzias latipes]